MTYANPQDVAAELRGSTSVSDAEAIQWQAWLDRVSRKIVAGFRRAGLDLDEQISLGDPTGDDVVDVEVAAVIRKIQNPNWGETSTTKSIDDGSITRRREGADPGIDPLDLLPSEWATLLPASQVGAYSTRPGFEPDGLPMYPLDWS